MSPDRFGGNRRATEPLDKKPTAATFTARYTSVCDVCGFDIDPGHECTWKDDQPVHLDCGDED